MIVSSKYFLLSSASLPVKDLEYHGMCGEKNQTIFLQVEEQIALFFIFQLSQLRDTSLEVSS